MLTVFLLLFSMVSLATPWKQPPEEILAVLHAESVPRVQASADGEALLLLSPVKYPPLADRAAAMLPLAGVRVDGRSGGPHGRSGYTRPRVRVDGAEVDIALPEGARVLSAHWAPDSVRLALVLMRGDHIGLWVGARDGSGGVVEGLSVVSVLGPTVRWMPDGKNLLVKAVPEGRGPAPAAPLVPAGPTVRTGNGDTATSTYEARSVLRGAHDEALFEHFFTSQLALVRTDTRAVTPIGEPHIFDQVTVSPDGRRLLVERLSAPWSHRHTHRRFGRAVEVWDRKGRLQHTVAVLPLADSVPIHGVAEGARSVRWRSDAPATLVWVEALDGGDWSTDVPHRDRLMVHAHPFKRPPVEVFRAEHRVRGWWWTEGGSLLVEQHERARRWRHVWLVDPDRRDSRALFDLSRNDRYADPGRPVTRTLPSGHAVLEQVGDSIFFAGDGASPTGDRPFLDQRSLRTGETERLFRSGADHYATFVRFTDAAAGEFIIRRESEAVPPNLHRVTLTGRVGAPAGEAARSHAAEPLTDFVDPTPQIRGIERRIVTYTRADGVPLSFTLLLPPGYQEGQRVPTVLYAYPREFSDAETAGQVRGSTQRFTTLSGSSHLFFLLQGYAVLGRTRLPVLGDPDTAYDTFVEQLVSGAEAAVQEAIDIGVADPDRIGVMGHSHGGLMTVTLLAHSDLFQAGIARSGAYNHTIRPFGFQSERRTLWEAPETYAHLSPVMHAPHINEPLLLIHGAQDENPGTVSLQSERLFEAVRGTGGTVRLVMLPHEGHAYRAQESVEHVLWEQLSWFDTHVRGAESPTPPL